VPVQALDLQVPSRVYLKKRKKHCQCKTAEVSTHLVRNATCKGIRQAFSKYLNNKRNILKMEGYSSTISHLHSCSLCKWLLG
jgi:hypothetical protein